MDKSNTELIKKNIALFIGALRGGGAERVVSRITHMLSDEYNVYVFLIDGENQAYECACPVIAIGGEKGSFRKKEIIAYTSINKYIKNYRIDVVISFMAAANIGNIIFAKHVKRIISIRSCYCKAVLPILEKGKRGDYIQELILQKTIYKLADAVVAVSQAQAELLVSESGIKREKVFTIENPYDIENILRMSEEEINADTKAFIDSHDTTVAVGRIAYQKNYPLMLKLFSYLVKVNPRAGLLILGSGDRLDEISTLISKYEIDDNVRLVGYVNNPFSYMSKCKAYISISKYEGFPNSLVEAMICGLPVIVTDCYTGPREILQHDGCEAIDGVLLTSNGLLMQNDISINDVNKIKKLSELWNTILIEPAIHEEYSKRSQKLIEIYTEENCFQKWKKLI